MAESQIRYRGLQVVVDTTQPAEFDIAELALPEEELEKAVRVLTKVPFSVSNRNVDGVQVREIQGLDYVYTVSRDEDVLVITIGAIRRPDPKNPTDEILKRLSVIDIVRGATGL